MALDKMQATPALQAPTTGGIAGPGTNGPSNSSVLDSMKTPDAGAWTHGPIVQGFGNGAGNGGRGSPRPSGPRPPPRGRAMAPSLPSTMMA